MESFPDKPDGPVCFAFMVQYQREEELNNRRTQEISDRLEAQRAC